MKFEKRLSLFLIVVMMLMPIMAYNINANSFGDFHKTALIDDYKKDCHKKDQSETKVQKTSCSSFEFNGFVQLFSNIVPVTHSIPVIGLLLISIGLPPIYRLFKPPRDA